MTTIWWPALFSPPVDTETKFQRISIKQGHISRSFSNYGSPTSTEFIPAPSVFFLTFLEIWWCPYEVCGGRGTIIRKTSRDMVLFYRNSLEFSFYVHWGRYNTWSKMEKKFRFRWSLWRSDDRNSKNSPRYSPVISKFVGILFLGALGAKIIVLIGYSLSIFFFLGANPYPIVMNHRVMTFSSTLPNYFRPILPMYWIYG